MLNFKIVVPIMVAIIFSYGFIRLGEVVHRNFNETDECKTARDMPYAFGYDLRKDLIATDDIRESVIAYSSYYNAFCKYPFEFPRG